MTIVKKKLVNKTIKDQKTKFINYLYFILLEIRNLDLQFKKPGKKTQVVNI